MNRKYASILALAAATLVAGQAMADDTVVTKTREQVNAEYADAVRTGDIMSTVEGYGGMKLNEVFPSRYPAKAKVAGKTSAQVNAEREEAIRSGDIVSSIDGDAGKKLNELYPNQYPSKAVVDLKTREQVNIEIAQSKHNNGLPNW